MDEDIVFATSLVALLTFISKEIYNWLKETKKSIDDTDSKQLEAIQENTQAITALKVEVQYMKEAFREVTEFRKDFYVMMAKFHDDPYRPDQ